MERHVSGEPLLPARLRRELIVEVERLEVPADAKVLLVRLADMSVAVGEKVVAIGRYVLTFVFDALKAFPMTSFGLLIGVVLALLVSSIAIVGGLLAPIVGPLTIALGIGVGAIADIRDQHLRLQIELFRAQVDAATRG